MSKKDKSKNMINKTDRLENDLLKISREAEKAAQSVDWTANRARIMRQIEEQASQTSKFSFLPSGINLKPAAAMLASFLLLGIITVTILIPMNSPGTDFIPVTRESAEIIQKSYARMDTVEYLRESKTILTEVVEEGFSSDNPEFRRNKIEKIEKLLRQKKFIDRNLEDYNLAKAKPVCDQIELLLYEIAASEDYNSAGGDIDLVKYYIDKEKLMFKINLLEDELS